MNGAGLILSKEQIAHKVARMAAEMVEANFTSSNFILIGIKKQGYVLAEQLAHEMKLIKEVSVKVLSLSLDKQAKTQPEIELSEELPSNLSNITIVLVDDVLNSGKTIFHAAAPLLKHPLETLQVAVMVERSHRGFPVKANYVGLLLNTTLQEHVEVTVDNESLAAVFLQ